MIVLDNFTQNQIWRDKSLEFIQMLTKIEVLIIEINLDVSSVF